MNSCIGLYKAGFHAVARSRGIWEEYLNQYGALPHIVRDVAAAFRGGWAPRGRGPRVGQLPQARHTFVDGMVDLEVLSFQVFAALSPVVEPDEEYPEVVLRAFADQERIARPAAGLVNQGRGDRPVNIVEHGLVQRCQDALECVVVTHGDAS